MATPSDMPVTPPQEVDRMVNAILEQVQAVATHSSRPIFFSSFNPEVCRQAPSHILYPFHACSQVSFSGCSI